MASSRRWASIISFIASFIHFFIIIFQVPLFRVPCGIGICTSPIEVTCSQLIATEVFPTFGVKGLLYPGVIAKAYVKNTTIPSYGKLLKRYNFTNLKKARATTDLQHLEILAGSYLTVAGAVFGLLKPGRMGLFGILLVIWGFIREVILGKSANMNHMNAVHIYPTTMSIAVLFAFLSIRKDVRMIIRSFRAQPIAKSLRSKSKHS